MFSCLQHDAGMFERCLLARMPLVPSAIMVKTSACSACHLKTVVREKSTLVPLDVRAACSKRGRADIEMLSLALSRNMLVMYDRFQHL